MFCKTNQHQLCHSRLAGQITERFHDDSNYIYQFHLTYTYIGTERNDFRSLHYSAGHTYYSGGRSRSHISPLRCTTGPRQPHLSSKITLQWRHNGFDGVSNRQPHDCLLNHLSRRRWKKTSKLRVTGLCEGNSSVAGEFPAQRASNAENVSILWCHHEPLKFGNG